MVAPAFIPPGFECRYQRVTLGTLAYRAAQPEAWPSPGAETLPLVFFHGFGGGSSSYEWALVYPAFAGEYRVLAPDLPGWGESDHPARRYQPQDYEGAIAEFLTAQCPDGAIVVASSLTAALMVKVANAHPELVRGMILMAPSGLKDFGESRVAPWILQLVQVPVVDRWLYWGAIATEKGIAQFLRERQFVDPERITPEMVAAYFTSARQPGADHAALSFVRGDLSFDLAEHWPQLTVPTVMLWGAISQLTPPTLGDRLAALANPALRDFRILPDVGLTPQLEQPEVTIAEIYRALGTLAVGTGQGCPS